MKKICNCEAKVGNLGIPNCSPLFGKPNRLIFAPLYKDDGTKFGIDPTSALDKTYFDSLQFAANQNERIYPVAVDLKNVEFARGDADFQEYEDGTKIKINEGTKMFKAIMPQISNTYLKELNTIECSRIGFYFVDVNGSLIGIEGATLLEPIPIALGTADNKFVHATDTTVQEVMIQFDVASSTCDEDMSAILASELNYDLNNLTGILTGVVKEVSNTLGSVLFTAKLIYGSMANKSPIKGLVAGDVALYNVTDSAAVSVSALTETSAGNYTVTFADQTASDVLRVTITKTGFAFNVVTTTLTA